MDIIEQTLKICLLALGCLALLMFIVYTAFLVWGEIVWLFF